METVVCLRVNAPLLYNELLHRHSFNMLVCHHVLTIMFNNVHSARTTYVKVITP